MFWLPLLGVAQLNRCVENWSRQYEGSEANNEGSAWIFPNTAFVRTASWDLDQIFNHKSSNGWNAFVANIVVFSNYIYVAANLDI